jgi:hypothetical protein
MELIFIGMWVLLIITFYRGTSNTWFDKVTGVIICFGIPCVYVFCREFGLF